MRLVLMLMTCGLLSCSSHQIDQKLLLGTWKNTELRVKMNSFKNEDSIKWLIAKAGEWEKVLKMKPIETTYFPDGTFESKYNGLDGQLLGTEKGQWQLTNDSLILRSANYNNSYKIYYIDHQLRFVSLLDWDEDGKKDDLYDGWQVKIDP
ncbi:MAG: hypothetical protein ABJF11_05985 [Reichenbachiella sp.]|uniref:hypothetical protein n=1 Tax=Reichenbachiella sp. TaxID=2184521 RepID=UPI0032649195